MPKMTKEELIETLVHLQESADPDKAHVEADKALLAYIDDEDVADAFEAIEKWYA